MDLAMRDVRRGIGQVQIAFFPAGTQSEQDKKRRTAGEEAARKTHGHTVKIRR